MGFQRDTSLAQNLPKTHKLDPSCAQKWHSGSNCQKLHDGSWLWEVKLLVVQVMLFGLFSSR